MLVFSKRSRDRLKGVHPNLVKVITRALEISSSDFSVTEGVRTIQRQKELVWQGKSQTMNSKHLVQSSGYGHAIDIVPYPVSWELEKFYPLAEAVRRAAKELNVNIRWGGCWVTLNDTSKPIKDLINEYSSQRRKQGKKPFIDCPHFELV